MLNGARTVGKKNEILHAFQNPSSLFSTLDSRCTLLQTGRTCLLATLARNYCSMFLFVCVFGRDEGGAPCTFFSLLFLWGASWCIDIDRTHPRKATFFSFFYWIVIVFRFWGAMRPISGPQQGPRIVAIEAHAKGIFLPFHHHHPTNGQQVCVIRKRSVVIPPQGYPSCLPNLN